MTRQVSKLRKVPENKGSNIYLAWNIYISSNIMTCNLSPNPESLLLDVQFIALITMLVWCFTFLPLKMKCNLDSNELRRRTYRRNIFEFFKNFYIFCKNISIFVISHWQWLLVYVKVDTINSHQLHNWFVSVVPESLTWLIPLQMY